MNYVIILFSNLTYFLVASLICPCTDMLLYTSNNESFIVTMHAGLPSALVHCSILYIRSNVALDFNNFAHMRVVTSNRCRKTQHSLSGSIYMSILNANKYTGQLSTLCISVPCGMNNTIHDHDSV